MSSAKHVMWQTSSQLGLRHDILRWLVMYREHRRHLLYDGVVGRAFLLRFLLFTGP